MKRFLLVMSFVLSFNVFAHQEVSVNCNIPHDDYPTLVTKFTFPKPSEVRGFVGFTHYSGISGYLQFPQQSLKVVNTDTHRIVKTSLQLFGLTIKAVNFPNEIFETAQYFDVEFVTDKGSMIGSCILQ